MHAENDFDLVRFVPYLIGRIGNALKDAIVAELDTEGVTLPMWLVLGVLWQRTTCNVGELSELSAIPLTALSRLIGVMEHDGIVVRRRSRSDARVVEVTLSPRGRAIVRRLIPRALALEARVLASLSPDQARGLRSSMGRIYASLHEDIMADSRFVGARAAPKRVSSRRTKP
jgi:DNA-binding MarR family transcriptional regulator